MASPGLWWPLVLQELEQVSGTFCTFVAPLSPQLTSEAGSHTGSVETWPGVPSSEVPGLPALWTQNPQAY